MRIFTILFICLAAVGSSAAQVKTGLDVLIAEDFAPLKGKRVGVITAQTGVTEDGRRIVDVLAHAPGVQLVAIFAPEHGLEGNREDRNIADSVDRGTGVPIHSLYNAGHYRPTPEMLKDVDVLVYDIQQNGARFLTRITTLGYAMEAAAQKGIPFYVLDRPNGINGVDFEGPLLDEKYISFVGYIRMPIRHGMTAGELAGMYNGEKHLGVDLHVIRMEGWKRSMWYDETGLDWIDPSPNIHNLTEATLYPGVCLLESPQISVGRGTDAPFERIGAPWYRAREVADYLNARPIPGVHFVPRRFTPRASVYKDQECEGLDILLVNRQVFDPVLMGMELLSATLKFHPGKFDLDGVMRLLGSDEAAARLKRGETGREVLQAMRGQLEEFAKIRAKYLLYENQDGGSSQPQTTKSSSQPTGGAASVQGWTPDDMLKVKSVSELQVSPDGRWVVFTVVQHDVQTSEPVSQIWVARADGAESFQLTRGARSSSSPRWSPDGKRIAFLSTRSGASNVWAIALAGGEAEQLTGSKSGVTAFRWSHNGQFVAFTAATDPSAEDEKRRAAKEDWSVVGMSYAYQRLWVTPVTNDGEGSKLARLLTKEDYHLGGAFGGGFMDWSPDDSKIAFAHMPRPRFDDWRKLDIAEVDLESGKIRPVAETAASEDTPLYSPDGKWIAYRVSDIPPGWAIEFQVAIVPASGGKPRLLAGTFNREPSLVDWATDSHSLIVQEALGTTQVLYRLPLDGLPVSIYAPAEGSFSGVEGTFSGPALNSTRTAIGFSSQASDRPPEAYVLPLNGGKPTQVSHVNADLPRLPLGRTEAIHWKGPGNLDIEGLLTYPVHYQKGKRYPLIVISHGGPPSNFSQNFIGLPAHYPIAAFAFRGYAVLRSNVRGSTGYGRQFRYANYGDWGGGDFHDMMAGVDKVIEMGIADPERLGVAGWSYGGYMTSWAITQTHRFKAASIGAPVTDLTSMNGTADMWTFVPDYMRAESWQKPEIYVQHSPVYNAKGVTTPALIQQGSEDTVVPLGQGKEYYNALQAQGVPVRMVVYPRSGHTPRESKILRHIMQENLDWFDKYLKVASPQ